MPVTANSPQGQRRYRLLRSLVLTLLTIALVVGIGLVLHALSAPTPTTAHTQAQAPTSCRRSLTPPEIQALSEMGVTIASPPVILPAGTLSESAAFAASAQQLAPSAATKATDIVCELALVTAPDIHPLATDGAPIRNQLLWIVMYQSLGPGSHGPSGSSVPRDLYMFFDASSGAYVFGLSTNQPRHG